MMLLRSRHEELDKFRSLDHRYNYAWIMFFGTQAPGLHPAAVKFSTIERVALANDVSALTDVEVRVDLEPYDAFLHNKRGVGEMHGSRG